MSAIQQTLSLALQHLNAGNLSQVESLARQVLTQEPDNPDALNFLSIVATSCNFHAEAVDFLLRAIAINPNNPEYHSNLGNIYTQQGSYDLAEKSLRRALALEPDYPNTYTALGCVYDRQQLYEQGEEFHRKALALDPTFHQAHNNLGISFHRRGNFTAAIESYERAIAHSPNFPDAHWNLSLTLLRTGNLQRGWREWEWRWKYKALPSPVRNFKQPLWLGEDLKDKTLLLHAEQGFGDSIQCARYIPLVAEQKPKKLFVECPPELKSLFASIPGITQLLFNRFDRLPPFDLHCPFMSLPLAFQTTLDNLPNTVPYLSAPQELIAHFQNLLTQSSPDARYPMPDIRVGIVWRGSTTHREDHTRSLNLTDLAPLFQISQVQFISLQLGPAAAQIKESGLPLLDFSAHLKDFAHTAALVMNLDFIISVDTSVAHLAGALAKPTWLLLPHLPDWRWLLNRNDSPWYPTMKLFRQPTPNSWPEVIRQVALEFRQWMHK